MRRTSIMTLGFVLIFIGVQLNLVETFVLTPRFSNFFSENGVAPSNGVALNPQLLNPANFDQYGRQAANPFYQASYPAGNSNPSFVPPAFSNQQQISPPNWICWPVLFLGTVVFLNGLSMRRDS